MEVYSDQASVELYLNGIKLGKKKIHGCRAMFQVKYAPGTLTAVAYDAYGTETGRSELTSAKGPFQVVPRPEADKVKPGDIVYVPVTVEGSNGVVESNADQSVTIHVEGGELLAFGSANPCTEEQYHTGTCTTYYGRALAIIRAGDTGTLKITV